MRGNGVRYGKMSETPIVINQIFSTTIYGPAVPVRRPRTSTVRYGNPKGTVPPDRPDQCLQGEVLWQ